MASPPVFANRLDSSAVLWPHVPADISDSCCRCGETASLEFCGRGFQRFGGLECGQRKCLGIPCGDPGGLRNPGCLEGEGFLETGGLPEGSIDLRKDNPVPAVILHGCPDGEQSLDHPFGVAAASLWEIRHADSGKCGRRRSCMLLYWRLSGRNCFSGVMYCGLSGPLESGLRSLVRRCCLACSTATCCRPPMPC